VNKVLLVVSIFLTLFKSLVIE